MTEAITEAVSVANATQTVSESVTVGVPDSSVRLRNPQNAIVRVNVMESPVEWAVAGIPVQIKNGEPGADCAVAGHRSRARAA
jgi:hypothetical protein